MNNTWDKILKWIAAAAGAVAGLFGGWDNMLKILLVAMIADYEDRKKWQKMMLVNIAKAGFFSSDRTIADYNRDIWKLK